MADMKQAVDTIVHGWPAIATNFRHMKSCRWWAG
jgi:hypothetical protein